MDKAEILDLHMHSRASDGVFNPKELMQFVIQKQGVRVVALTDHDTVAGVAQARAEAELLGAHFVSGIEVSCTWGRYTIHIVGLGVDETNTGLVQKTLETCNKRDTRAQLIAQRFEQLGIGGMWQAALDESGTERNISRVHFGRALLKRGVVKNLQEAFDRYLGDGQCCFVPTPWRTIDQGIQLIQEAGGVAVLAHPGRYRMDADWQIDALVEHFASCGGQGIEVVSGSQGASWIPRCMIWAKQYGLLGSTGSDFHSPTGNRPLPGEQGQLPEGIESIMKIVRI